MSARSLNKVMLLGNLTRDPELKYTGSGTAVCTFGLATNRSWSSADSNEVQEETEYHRIVAWSKLGEICSQLLFKGRKVYVEGRLQTRRWTGQDGQERNTTEIVIDEMIALGSPRGAGGGYNDNSGGSYEDDSDYGDDNAPSDASDVVGKAPGSSDEEEKPSKEKDAPTKEAEEKSEVDVDDIPF
jgi:single-strand DNA-binding protein